MIMNIPSSSSLSPHGLLVTEVSVPTTTTSSIVAEDDIVGINAGGTLFLQVLRSTLCLPPANTRFVQLFTHDETSSSAATTTTFDKEGRVFLDHDPELIETIINFLRMKKIEEQDQTSSSPFYPVTEPPKVPSHKRNDFRRLLHHFELTSYFQYATSSIPSPPPSVFPPFPATTSASTPPLFSTNMLLPVSRPTSHCIPRDEQSSSSSSKSDTATMLSSSFDMIRRSSSNGDGDDRSQDEALRRDYQQALKHNHNYWLSSRSLKQHSSFIMAMDEDNNMIGHKEVSPPGYHFCYG